MTCLILPDRIKLHINLIKLLNLIQISLLPFPFFPVFVHFYILDHIETEEPNYNKQYQFIVHLTLHILWRYRIYSNIEQHKWYRNDLSVCCEYHHTAIVVFWTHDNQHIVGVHHSETWDERCYQGYHFYLYCQTDHTHDETQ